jgi:hypothetical protein
VKGPTVLIRVSVSDAEALRRQGKLRPKGRPKIDPELEKQIRKALKKPGRPGVRVIAERFGVSPTTVQRIARS